MMKAQPLFEKGSFFAKDRDDREFMRVCCQMRVAPSRACHERKAQGILDNGPHHLFRRSLARWPVRRAPAKPQGGWREPSSKELSSSFKSFANPAERVRCVPARLVQTAKIGMDFGVAPTL